MGDAAIKANTVATYFNIMMGIFQVASIIELFVVLGEIKLAANNDREPTSVSLVWIAISYVFAGLVSIASFTEMCYVMVNFDNSSRETQA